MHDNPDAAQTRFFDLPQQRIVALDGRDALAFAQAQFMNDVATLAIGQWQWSGWLTPKGRLVALFALLRTGPETLWLLLADADAGDFADRLRRFVFRSKVAIGQRDDLRVSGGFDAPIAARGAVLSGLDDGRIELDFGGDGGARTVRIAQATQADAAGDANAIVRWTQADLEHGLPRLGGRGEQWTPQQLSLDRLRAYSVKKGCYPGQEIVARTHFLGQAKRGLMRLRCARAYELDEVYAADAPIGQIVCAAGDEALAVMPLELPAAPLTSHDAPCIVLPLLAGLAR